MRRLTNFIFLPILTLALLNFGITEADVTYVGHYCPNTTTFTTNSTYQANLNRLLSSLTSNSTRPNGFYNTTTGGGQADQTIYGLFLCRGDVSTDVCQECVNTTSEDALRRCPIEKSTIIWYDECMLRYSNQSNFSTVDTNRPLWMYNTGNVSEESRFKYNQAILDTSSDVVSRAANDQTSGKKFAVKEVNYTASEKLYMLAQCTPDLTVSGCTGCLNACVDSLPTTSDRFLTLYSGVRVVHPSCNIRFETYPFYNVSATALPPASSPSVIVPPPDPATKGNEGSSSRRIIAVGIPIVIIAMILCMLKNKIGLLCRKKHRIQAKEEEHVSNDLTTTAESLQFNLSTIQTATNDFSGENKVGEGGFGGVYKGTLSNGQQVAVKRLSRRSGQGAEEFKTEVVLVAKLQHRNLVRLLGFCLEGQEKILIYEFVPNKSLDYFLFDPEKQGQLDWSRRYKIIQGITRGILYLHEDSRLKIIHRDLKASNVLLDEDMNPKISDFGLARIFGVHQTEANTNRIVGT